MKKEGSKEIRDYVHLYIGCEVVVKNKNTATLCGVSYDENRKGFVHLSSKEVPYYVLFILECKLILRPLSSILFYEVELFCNIGEDQKLLDFKVHESFIEIKFDNGEEKDCYYHYYFYQLSPRQFHILLSKHFDLFGLIESGLAIDATTLNTQSKTSK